MEAGSIAAKRNGTRKHWLRNHRNPCLEVMSSWISCTVEACLYRKMSTNFLPKHGMWQGVSRPELWQEGSPQWIAINLLSFLTVFSCCRHPKSQREVRRRRGGIEVWQRLLRVKRLKHIQKLQKQYKSNIKAYKSYRTGSFDMVEGMGA